MAQHDRDRLARNDDTASSGRLVHTRDLDKFEFPKDSPDPRGWDVRSADGTKVGKVEDLIVDPVSVQIISLVFVHGYLVACG